jgi:hypothetical protein
LTDVNVKRGTLSGMINKKIVSISGKKHSLRVYFEGEIIDGINHTFTSNLTSKCEALDVYFWSRFPSFKEVESLRDLRKHQYIYMRWNEKSTLKTKRRAIESTTNHAS